MAIPKLSDLVLYVNKKLTGNDWNTNFQKIINWFTDGKTEIKVKSVEISSDGGLINNGSTQQSGNVDVDGNITASGNITAGGVISGDGSGLYNLESAKMFPYVPWCVNSGNKDDEGNGDLISATSIVNDNVIIGYTIAFKVDNDTVYGKIGATTASGEHFFISSLQNDTISALNTETFYFLKKGELFTTKLENIKIFRQKIAPTGADAVNNNIWLDTSSEVLVCKKYKDGVWEEWDYVPLGKVVTAASLDTEPTITTFVFNQNEYNVNSYSEVITTIYDKATKFPNYAGGYQVAYSSNNTPVGWTATADGWIRGVFSSGMFSDDIWLRINNVDIVRGSRSGISFFVIGLLPIKKGDYVEVRNGAVAYFYPNR